MAGLGTLMLLVHYLLALYHFSHFTNALKKRMQEVLEGAGKMAALQA